MFVAAALLVPLAILAVVLFLRTAPRARRFNSTVLSALAAVCALVSAWLWWDLRATPDRDWWPVVAALWCVAIVIATLVVAAIARSFLASRDADS